MICGEYGKRGHEKYDMVKKNSYIDSKCGSR